MWARFETKKHKILAALSRPDTDYIDASPKGFVDDGVRELIGQINDTPGFVTTSSCAGRIAVYLEGPPKPPPTPSPLAEDGEIAAVAAHSATVASASGKGGGRWLFSSHAPLDLDNVTKPGALLRLFGFSSSGEISFPLAETEVQYVHLKFEPMILHVLTASVEEAQTALHAAVQSGFRESGISGLLDGKGQPSTPMVAVRSSGLALDSVIGFKAVDSPDTGTANVQPMVTESYLRTIVGLANDRFTKNEERKTRFWEAFLKHASPDPKSMTKQLVGGYESAAARKERLRMEGLERRQQMLLVGGALDGGDHGDKSHTIEQEVDYGFDLLTVEEPESVHTQNAPDDES